MRFPALSEARAKRDALARELEAQRSAKSASRTKIAGVEAGLADLDAEIGAKEGQLTRIAELAGNSRNRESGDGCTTPLNERTKMSTKPKIRGEGVSEVRDAALRAVDSAFERGQLNEPAGERLVDLVNRDKFGLDSAYIDAVSDPVYERAFAKRLAGVDGAEGILNPDEAAAMQRVGQAMATRAMAAGEGSTGGYAVPLSLDPTILLTNDGAVNPIRDLATVSTITTTKWQGVSSAGVEAEFAAEAAEAEDNSPELGQPEITPEMARIWCPYSIETGMDWSGLSAELAKLFADAKSVKEAEVFATGKGEENIPQGLVTGAEEIVETKTKEVLSIGDIYVAQEALAPRWQPKATFLGSNTVANEVHKMVAAGDTENARIMPDTRDSILGKPFREVSTMSVKTTTKKERVLAYGDIASAFRVVDRIGMNVELVPLVLKEGVPTGERGLFAWFRVGSKVIIPEAVQVLAVKE